MCFSNPAAHEAAAGHVVDAVALLLDRRVVDRGRAHLVRTAATWPVLTSGWALQRSTGTLNPSEACNGGPFYPNPPTRKLIHTMQGAGAGPHAHACMSILAWHTQSKARSHKYGKIVHNQDTRVCRTVSRDVHT